MARALTFLLSFWGKATLVLVLLASLSFAVHRYNDSIRQAAYDTIFRDQVEEAITQRDKAQAELLRQLGIREAALTDALQRNADLVRRNSDLQTRIQEGLRTGTLKDQPVGSVLRETLRGLK